MKKILLNFLGVLIAISIINFPSYFLTLNASDFSESGFNHLGIAVGLVVFSFFILSFIKVFEWVKKTFIAGIIIGFAANSINTLLLTNANQFYKDYSKSRDFGIVKDLQNLEHGVYYRLGVNIAPDLKLNGRFDFQYKKGSNYIDSYFVYPIPSGKDSARYFFAFQSSNSLLGISIENQEKIISSGERILVKVKDTFYVNAVKDFQKKSKEPVSKNFSVYKVTDPLRVYEFALEYYLLSLLTFNGIYLFALLLVNLKIKKEN